MKLPDSMRPLFVAFACGMLLTSGPIQARGRPAPIPETANGPAADYPITIGDPFTIGDTTYTPADTMNYDQVGYVAADDDTAIGITGSHKTLPLPSYVEVTALDTGRTILVRLERRGPMTNDRLLALSPAAMQQLGVADGAAIRMRRVNPPEEDRFMLREGKEAPLRMSTPQGLLEVLRKRLPEVGSASLYDARQAQVSGKEPSPEALAAIDPDKEMTPDVAPAFETAPEVATPPPSPPPTTMADKVDEARSAPEPTVAGHLVVQLGAFSVRANAENLAKKVGGNVTASGSLSLVRVGPFATRGQAADALAKLRAQGYSDALIQTLD
jgi:rare lipoprotein A